MFLFVLSFPFLSFPSHLIPVILSTTREQDMPLSFPLPYPLFPSFLPLVLFPSSSRRPLPLFPPLPLVLFSRRPPVEDSSLPLAYLPKFHLV